jgi:aspartyl-tRNA(Asn)/glutamyl-tRNA(Gln) amidotransferase subunit A
MSIPAWSAIQWRDAIRRGEVNAEGAVRAALDRVRALDGALGAFVAVEAERALARAREFDRTRPADAPLGGVPVAIKDNICVRGMRTTAGSRVLGDWIPPYDATAVERLEAAGAIIIGKTNCDEFAMGSSTEHSAFGPTRNPWDLDRTPGGSSGGSAAAVAAGIVPVALGSDTGGSVRQPAALCGVVGVKPTYGRVSRYGLIAFASSLDQIGVLATTVADAALVTAIMSGADVRDSTSVAAPAIAASPAAGGDLRGVRIGVPWHLLAEGVDADVRQSFEASVRTLERLGADVREVALSHSRLAIPVYYLVATAEASSNLARYDGVRYGRRAAADSLSAMYDRTRSAGFGTEVKRRIMLGTYGLSAGYYEAFYVKAQQVRTLIRRDFDQALTGVDAILLPTSPTTAFRLGERTADPIQMYLADVFTVGASLAGLPAASVPSGLTPDGLPVGLQIIAKAWDEDRLFRLAAAFEQAAGPLPSPAGLKR